VQREELVFNISVNLANSAGQVLFFELKYGTTFWLMQVVNHVYFSPDGQWVASASFD
jgi:hypothetical protein